MDLIVRQGVFALIFCVFAVGLSQASTWKMVFTSNMPNVLAETDRGSYPQLATYLAQQRENHDVLFLFGGDSLFPSAFSSYDQGAHVIDMLNNLQVNAMSVGHSEFSKGIDNLVLQASNANFPIVASNLVDTRFEDPIELLFPSYIANVSGQRIGLIGLVGESVVREFAVDNLRLIEIQNALNTQLTLLNSSSVDAVILMVRRFTEDQLSALDLTGIDLILSSWQGGDEILDIQSIPLIRSGGHDGEVSLITWDSNTIRSLEVQNFSDLPDDRSLSKMVERMTLRVDIVLGRFLATTETALDSLRANLRQEESALGNAFADAIRNYMETDIALINAGAIRGDREYPAGYRFRRLDVETELPFDDQIRTIELTGDQLIEVFEHSVSAVEETSGRFLQVSGISVRFDSSRPPYARIIAIERNGEALKPDGIYSVALSRYLLNGGDGYAMLTAQESQARNRFARSAAEMVSHQFSEQRTFKAQRTGRLVDIASTRVIQ